jgi:small basic protein (TIGR04137 family)
VSIHKSLRGAGAGGRHRNVLTRIERLEKLKDMGKWTEEDGAFGLPKVRTLKIKVGGKKKKKKEAEAEGEAVAAPAAT